LGGLVFVSIMTAMRTSREEREDQEREDHERDRGEKVKEEPLQFLRMFLPFLGTKT